MPLTDISIRTAKPKDKQYKLADSAGLYLLVKSNGAKYWRLKYRIFGKEKLLSIGTYPSVSLSEAREKVLQAKKQVSNNIDPSLYKKEEKLRGLLGTENSFETIARDWHNNHKERWTKKHCAQILKRLEDNIFPILGFKEINSIKAPELLAALRTIESRGAIEVAHRVLQICGQVLRYAVAIGIAERDISADIRGALKTRKQKNYSHILAKELPEFLDKLEKYDGGLETKLALKLLILTFVRTTELRAAKWDEIDFEKQEWRIPAERMKMGDSHIVPLSTQVIKIFRELHLLTSYSVYAFPNRNNPKHYMSQNTMLYAIYRMGYHSRATVHGFRATASTILNENGFCLTL